MNKNILILAELVSKYPDMEVIAMVDSNVVLDDEYTRWIGSIGGVRLEEYYWRDERIYFKSADEEDLKEDYLNDIFYENENSTDEELEKLGDEYLDSVKWTKAIVVNIDTY